MKQFSGFPARTEYTPLPNAFFSGLLPQIDDMAELKTTLHVLATLYRKKGYPRFVTYKELLGNDKLMHSLRGAAKSTDEALRDALKMAAERGTFIHLALDKDGNSEDIYLLNDKSSRQAVSKIKIGELKLTGLKYKTQAYVELEEQPNVFKLYEDNIGMLDPMIAEQLRDAEKQYPSNWIHDAIKEAVNQGIHKWSYISAILTRWAAEGRSDGTYRRHPKKTDPDKYIKGKYGHMVRR